jgi:ABC-type uncharacterized transport system permease subunit
MKTAAMILTACAALAYAASLVLYLVRRREAFERRGLALVGAGLGLHTAAIVLFWVAYRLPPWATACGVLALWSWAAVAVLIVLASRRGMQVVGALVVPVVLMMFAAAFVVPKRPFRLPAGTPELLAAHIPLVFLAYTAFLYAAVSGGLYLVQERRIKRKGPSAVFGRIPPLEWLDRFTAGSLLAGFVVLTVGLAIGFAWLAAAGLRGGLHDPKIPAIGIAWLLYGALVVARFAAWTRGRRVAAMAVACFILVLALHAFVRHAIPNGLAAGGAEHAEQGASEVP